MPSLVIRLDPKLLVDPDADLRYDVPEALVATSPGLFRDEGYDYEHGTDAMLIYLTVTDRERAVDLAVRELEGRGLCARPGAAIVGISERPFAESQDFVVVYPKGSGTVISKVQGGDEGVV